MVTRDLFFRATVLIALLFCCFIGADNPAVAQVAKAAAATDDDTYHKKDRTAKPRVLGEDHSVIVFSVGKQIPIIRLEIGKSVLFSQDEVKKIHEEIGAMASKGMDRGIAEFFPKGVKTDPSEKRVWVTERYLPGHYNIRLEKGELILNNGEDNTDVSLGSIDLFTDEELPNVKRGTIVGRKIGQEVLDRADKYFHEHGIEVDPQPGVPRTDKDRQETKKDATN